MGVHRLRFAGTGWALVLSLTVLSCPGLLKSSAQSTTLGSIEGVVLDRQGKPIPDATVYALPQGDMRILAASSATDSAGKFILQSLQAGGFYIYAYKESDGYPNAFFRFFTIPNSQSQVAAKVEAGQVTTGITIKLIVKFAHLKIHVTDENGIRLGAGLTFRREDQRGDYIMGTDGQVSILVPPVPFRLTVDADGYEPWHYGGANYAGKPGLISPKPDQTLNLDVRLHRK